MHKIKIPVQELLLKMRGEGLICEEGGYHCSTMIMIKQCGYTFDYYLGWSRM